MIQTSTGAVADMAIIPASGPVIDWRQAPPLIDIDAIRLRELRLQDAASLLEMLSTDEVGLYISPSPTTIGGFERFIPWTHRERAAGRYICFGIVPEGFELAVGLIQVRALHPRFEIAEWGFAIGETFWGTGVFPNAAREVLSFAFDTLGTQRIEARVSDAHGRGNGALRKLGARHEGILRESFLREGVRHDQVIWSIAAADWRRRQPAQDRRNGDAGSAQAREFPQGPRLDDWR